MASEKKPKDKKVDAKAIADKALDLVLKQINKTKKGEEKKIKIGRYGELKALNLPAIPTGSLALDTALGIGGVPRGRIVEVYGPESSGKTTLCLHIIAEAQKEGGTAAFIDAEHSFDVEYAKRLGVNMNDLLISQPDDGSEAMEIVDMLARSTQLSLIVIDSVAGLVPRAEMDGEITDTHIGQQARLMSQALRRLATICGKTGTTLIFTNQIRYKIGVMFGNPETTPGGNALKHYTSQRLDIRRGKPIKEGDQNIGAETRVRVVKNKVAPPFRVAHFNIMYGTGIDREADVIATAASLGIVNQAGPWYSYNEEKLGQGLENACACVKETPGLMDKIRKQVLERCK